MLFWICQRWLEAVVVLAEAWEAHFDAANAEAPGGESLCLIALDPASGRPCGFALTAVHRDSDMWRYYEWVEVEALYVDDAWSGRGLAETLPLP